MSASAGLRAEVVARVGRVLLEADVATGPGSLALVGPNGAGKTSLLLAVLGALPVERARVEVDGHALQDTAAGVDVPVERRRLGYVPQDYALFPHLSVRGNVELAVRSAWPREDRGQIAARVERALRDLDVAPLADRRPGSLSGGERQRVALARAMSVEPRALLLDEPLAALDVPARRQVRRFLAERLAALALPALVVTHDPLDARALGQRIAVLEAGRVTQLGAWEELAAEPATPFVAELVAAAREA